MFGMDKVYIIYVLPLNEGLFFIVVEYLNTNAYHENLVLHP